MPRKQKKRIRSMKRQAWHQRWLNSRKHTDTSERPTFEPLESKLLLSGVSFFADDFVFADVVTDNGTLGALDAGDEVALADFGGGTAVFGTDAFDTIQGAINAAGVDDIVNIGAGTFVEGPQVQISQNLDLVGQGAGVTIIEAGGDTSTGGDARGWFLVDEGVNLNVSNMSFDGAGNLIWQAFRHKGSGTFDSVQFNDIQYQTSGSPYAGTAIAAFGTASDVDVTNSTFSDIGRIGVLYFGSGTTGTFADNTYTGKGAGDWLDYALDISAGATVEAYGNTITDNLGVAASDGSTSAGILVSTFFAPGTNADIHNNTITGNSTGVFVGFDGSDTSTATVNDNDLSGNGAGVRSTAAPVDAGGNWWGSADETVISGLVSGDIDFSPYLTDGTDTDGVTPGFQPNAASLTETLQAQIDNAAPGSTLNVAPGNYNGVVIAKDITLDGGGSGVIINGGSPALTVTAGNVVIQNGVTLTTGTDDATVLVTGGSLTVRNSTLTETGGGEQAAIRVTAGAVDLGTAGDLGGNILDITGLGELVQNTSGTEVSAVGNTWRQDGVDLPDFFAVEDEITGALDAGGAGLVRLVDGQVFVTTNTLGIQAGIDAASTGNTVTVDDGTYVENVQVNKSVTLLSENGQASTTIQGTSGLGALGTVQLMPGINDVVIGGVGQGFTINGINGNGAIENAAVYLQGNHSNIEVRNNEIVADGDAGLTSEFGATVDNVIIDGNTFSGQTFVGPNPGGIGFSTQFNVGNNVPRQLVVMGGGTGGGNTSNITFTNNQITGTAGGISSDDLISEQGNTLVTIDVVDATITGNTFAGTTARFGTALRARGTGADISGNIFDATNQGPNTSYLFLANPSTSNGLSTDPDSLGDVVTNNTFNPDAVIVDGGNTVFITSSIQAAIDASAPGTPLRFSGEFTENVDVNKALLVGGNFTLNGTLTVSDAGATLSAGFSPGIIASGDLALTAGSTLGAEVNGTAAGTEHSQYAVTGTVDLGGATLDAFGSITGSIGDTVVLVDNDGVDAVTGTFAGLANASTLTINSETFAIFYDGGDGNDVVLVRAPGTLSTLVVDDDFAGATLGSDPDGAGPAEIFGYNAFATIQEAIDAADAGATILINAGTYNEALAIAKSVDLVGDPGDALEGEGASAPVIDGTGLLGFVGATVTGALTDASFDGFSFVNWFTGNLSVTDGLLTISDSTVDGGLVGVEVNSGTANIDSSILTNAGIFGVELVNGGSTAITGSQITNATTAGVSASSGNADISESILTGNGTGLLVGATGTGTVFGSSLGGNTLRAISNSSATAVDASGNYWGTTSEAAVAAETLGFVDYSPFLTISADSDPAAAGFQGDFSNLVVTTQGEQTAGGRIQEGVDTVNAGGDVTVLAGTYIEQVEINQALNLLGPNAGINPNTTPRGAEAIILPDATGPDVGDANYVFGIYINVDGVTVDGMLIDGDNPSLNSGVVRNGADLDSDEGIVSYEGVDDITVVNNIVRNTGYTGINFYNFTDTSATANNEIAYNLIENLGDASWGIGVLLHNNFYADVHDNVIDDVRVGVQTGNFSQANPGTPDDARIRDNVINARRSGIFYNLHYSGASPFTIADNAITAIDDPSLTNWFGIALSSQQNAADVNVLNNTIDGSASSLLAAGYSVWNTPTTADLTVSGGTVTGVDYGVWINNFEGYNSDGGFAHVDVSGVDITASTAGVYVLDSPSNTNGSLVEASLSNATVITAPTGVLVEGADATLEWSDASVTINPTTTGLEVNGGAANLAGIGLTGHDTGIEISGGSVTMAGGNILAVNAGISMGAGAVDIDGVTISGAAVGIDQTSGSLEVTNSLINANTVGIAIDNATALIQGTDLTGNTVGLRTSSDAIVDAGQDAGTDITGLGISTGGNTLIGYTGAAGNFAIENLNTTQDVFAQLNDFGTTSVTLIEGVIFDDTDNPLNSQVIFSPTAAPPPAPAVVYVDEDFTGTALGADPDGAGVATSFGFDAFTTIQDGIDAVALGGTVIVFGDSYDESITIDKSLSLLGQADPDNAPDTDAILTSTTGSNDKVLVEVIADDVTIDGLTIIVDRDHASGGIAASNIAVPDVNMVGGSFDNLVISNNTIRSEGENIGSFDLPGGLSASAMGIALIGNGGPVHTVTLTGNTVEGTNTATPIPQNPTGFSGFTRGIYLGQVQATLGGAAPADGNSAVGFAQDLLFQFASNDPDSVGGTSLIQNNTFLLAGVDISSPNANAPVDILDNNFDMQSELFAQSLLVRAHHDASSTVTVQGNTFTGHTTGIAVDASSAVVIDNNNFTADAAATGYAHIVLDTNRFNSTAVGGTLSSVGATITSNTFNGSVGNGTALLFQDSNTVSTPAVSPFDNVVIGGSGLENSFGVGLTSFITLDRDGNNTLGSPVANDFDATDNLFDVGSGLALPTAMTINELLDVEDRILHAIDNGSLGLVTVVDNNVYVTVNSFDGVDTFTPSVQRGIDAASINDTVNIGPGTFAENLTIGKDINLDGQAGLTTLTPSGGGNIITIAGSGFGDDQTVLIQDIDFDGLAGTAGTGVFVGSAADFANLTIENGDFTGMNLYGVGVFGNATTGLSVQDVDLTKLTFSGNGIAGGGGTADVQFFQYNGDATLTDLTMVGNRNEGAGTGARGAVQFRGVGDGAGVGVIPAGNVVFDNVDITGSYRNQFIGIQRYSDVANFSFNDVALGGGGSDLVGSFGAVLRFDGVGDLSSKGTATPTSVDLGNTYFRGITSGGLGSVWDIEFAPDNTFAWLRADATNTQWDTTTGTQVAASSLTLDELFEVEDRILHFVEPDHPFHLNPFRGFVEIVDGTAYITETFGSLINRGIEVVDEGGTVFIDAGTYTEDVNVNRFVQLDGSGSGSDPLANTVITPASGAAGLTISTSGLDALNPITVQDVHVTGSSNHGVLASGQDFLEFDNVESSGNDLDGFHLSDIDGLVITDSTASNNGVINPPTVGSGFGLNGVRDAVLTNLTGVDNYSAAIGITARAGTTGNSSNIDIVGGTFSDGTSTRPDGSNGINLFVDDTHGASSITDVTIGGTVTLDDFLFGGITLFNAGLTSTIDNIQIGQTLGDDIDLTNNVVGLVMFGNVTNVNADADFTHGVASAAGVIALGLDDLGSFSPDLISVAGSTFTGYSNAAPAISLASVNPVPPPAFNIGVNAIDVTGATFDGVDPGSLATGDPAFWAIEDQIVHAIDVQGAGLIDFDPVGNHYLTTSSFVAGINTNAKVQRAVDAATSGDTIFVQDGNYVEGSQVVINKDIMVDGQSRVGTILTPGFDTGTSGNARGWWLVEAGNTLDVSGLTYDATGNLVWQAVRQLGSGSFDDVAFSNIQFNASGPNYQGTAIAAFGVGSDVDVSNSFFSDIGRIGVLYFGGSTTGTFSGNTYTGKGAGDFLDYALDISAGAVIDVTNNVISNNLGVASVDGSTSAGVLVSTFFGPGTQATLSGNQISGSTSGVVVGFDGSDTSTVSITGDTLTGNEFGVSVNGSTNVSVNAGTSIQNGTVGVNVDSNGSVAITGATITGNTAAGVNVGSTGNAVITGSDILGVAGSTGVLVSAGGTASVLNNPATITGHDVGIHVDGGTALVENNDLNGNTIGVLIENNGIADLGDTTGSDITGLGTGSGTAGSSAGLNDFSGYISAATASDGAIVNLNNDAGLVGPQGTPPDVTAFNNTWNDSSPAGIENVIYHDADDNNLGYIDFANLSSLNVSLDLVTIDENGTVQLLGTFTNDPQDHTLTIDWGDGTIDVIAVPQGTFDLSTLSITHQYLDDGLTPGGSDTFNYPIQVTLAEDAGPGTLNDNSLSVTVNNVAPNTLALDPVVSIDEDGTATLSGTFADAGTLDEHTVTVDWGDGTVENFVLTVGDRSFSFNHQYLDDGLTPGGAASFNYNIDVTVDDDDTGSVNDQATVTVNNVAPNTLALDPVVSIDEDGTATLSGTFADAGTLDEHTVTVDWGDGTVENFVLTVGDRSFSFNHQYLDDGLTPGGAASFNYNIDVTVDDDDTGSVNDQATVTVNNVAPNTLALDPVVSIDEDGTATLSGTFADAGTLDEHTVTVDWGDGTVENFVLAVGDRSFSFNHQYLDDGLTPGGAASFNYNIDVTIDDDDTGSVNDQATVTVNNVAPLVSITGLPLSSDEGAVINLTANVTDPGTLDTFNYDWVVLKDGLPFASLNVDNVNTFDFTPDDNATYDITLTVTDDDTGVAVVNTSIVIDNVTPTVALTGAAATDEGSVYTLNIGAVTDPGDDTVASYRVLWGDGSFDVFTPAQLTLMSGQVTHTYQDGPGGVTQISVEITDEDGVHANAGVLPLTVNNLNPFGSFTNGGAVDAGDDGFVTWFGQGDASPIDATSLTYDFDFGDDGSFEITNSGFGFATVPGALLTTPGTYDVRSIIRDKDGGFLEQVTTITIDPVSFRVTSFTPNASGFDAVLSGDLDLSVFNLYDGFDAADELPDLFLVGTATEIAGSTTYDAATRTLSFVATGGVLAPDNYGVFFVSGTDAFKELGTGALLDGNADGTPGDNYITNFVVNASTDRVLSLPDFARGPGQDVNTPATGVGLPVTIDDATGVNAIDFDILYDPTLLNITGASLGAALPGDWIITTNDTTPGVLKITISGITTLSGTDLEVVNLTADVPSSADFGAAQVIRIDNLMVNGGFIGSVGDSAFHKAAYLGDVDGDFFFSGLDAGLISGVVVDLVSGFDAFDKTDPVILANSTGTGEVNGLDASYVAQKSVALPRPEIPDLPPIAPAGVPGEDPILTVASSVNATIGSTVSVPVGIDDAEDLLGFNLDLVYDTNVLDLTNGDVNLGSLLTGAGGWSVVANVDDVAGTVKLAFFRAGNPMPAGGGEVVTLDFTVLPGAASLGVTNIAADGPTDLGGKTYNYIDGSINVLPITGDLNSDGFVGIDDLNIVLGNWNQNVTAGDLLSGDPSGDGFVGIDDLNTVLGNWNAGTPPVASVSATPAASQQQEETASQQAQTAAPLEADETQDDSSPVSAEDTTAETTLADTPVAKMSPVDSKAKRQQSRSVVQKQSASLQSVQTSQRQTQQASSLAIVNRVSSSRSAFNDPDDSGYEPVFGLWESDGEL